MKLIMNSRHVKSVTAIGIHGRFDIELTFDEHLNILYGKNGTGKTTLLHILANILNGDYERFACLKFNEIQLVLSDGDSILVAAKNRHRRGSHVYTDIYVNGELILENISPRDIDSDKSFGRIGLIASKNRNLQAVAQKRLQSPVPAAYFPSFRTMIEAWAASANPPSQYDDSNEGGKENQHTIIARQLFGAFVPRLDFPSIFEIESTLEQQISEAIMNVAQIDRKYVVEVPSNILKALSQKKVGIEKNNVAELVKKIDKLSEKLAAYPVPVTLMQTNWHEYMEPLNSTDKHLAAVVLYLYFQALEQIVCVQEQSFSAIEQFLASVNYFLEDKNIAMSSAETQSSGTPKLVIRFNDGSKPSNKVRHLLSSGERQILTLLYMATQMSQKQVVLIDEPEISLHVDWQRSLIKEMSKQMGHRQIIVCTHSPVIGADYDDDKVIIFKPKPTTRQLSAISANDFVKDGAY